MDVKLTTIRGAQPSGLFASGGGDRVIVEATGVEPDTITLLGREAQQLVAQLDVGARQVDVELSDVNRLLDLESWFRGYCDIEQSPWASVGDLPSFASMFAVAFGIRDEHGETGYRDLTGEAGQELFGQMSDAAERVTNAMLSRLWQYDIEQINAELGTHLPVEMGRLPDAKAGPDA